MVRKYKFFKFAEKKLILPNNPQKKSMKEKKFRFPVTSLAGSSVPNLLKICREHRVEPAYYPKLTLTFLAASFFEIFNAWERMALRGRMKSTRIEKPPVFIIGFWRSGTTLLHNLLCTDPDAAYTTTFQTVFPHLTVTQLWLKKIVDSLLPEKRPFDNVSWNMDTPQEEEFGMANLQPYSLYNFFLFPKEFDRFAAEELFTGSFGPAQLENWKKQYLGMIRKSMINKRGTRYISKNPLNMVRIRMLKEMFPDAKFIFIYRNPYSVVESLYRFTLSIFPGVKLQEVPESFTREKIARLYNTMMREYFMTKSILAPGDLAEIRMEDFVKDVTGHLGKIYGQFGIPGFERMIPLINTHLSRNGSLERDSYEICRDTYTWLNELCPDIIEQLGYPIKMPESMMQDKVKVTL
jgi:hypothetical protein